MKVVFMEDVSAKEKKGDIRDVAEGYARNYLLPKGLALAATPSAIKAAQKLAEERERKRARRHDEYIDLARHIEGKELTFKTKASSKGTLHGSITTADIAASLSEIVNAEIDRKKIALKAPLHKVGRHEMQVVFAKDISASIIVIVEGESA